jgi:hypothetical protein
MKPSKWMMMIVLCGLFSIAPTQHSSAADPILEVIKQAVIKVIKAVDLMIQRLQNVTIALQNAQKQLENAMSKLHLKEISDWAQKQRDLYKEYYDELWKVKMAIAYYQRIKQVIEKQGQLVDEYKQALGLFKQDKHFTSSELDYMRDVYSGILEGSVKNLDEIMMVISSFNTQMSDAKRLEILHHAASSIDENLSALRAFNNHNVALSLSRAKDAYEIAVVKKLYGLK